MFCTILSNITLANILSYTVFRNFTIEGTQRNKTLYGMDFVKPYLHLSLTSLYQELLTKIFNSCSYCTKHLDVATYVPALQDLYVHLVVYECMFIYC